MSIIGNPLITTNYISDSFSGDASTVAFTLSQAPASDASIAVYISGLYQIPTSAYTITGTTLTFTGAPPTGTNNITVLHLGVKSATLVPVAASVTPAMLNNANVIYWSISNNNIGIGTTSPAVSLDVGNSTDAIRVPIGNTAQRPSNTVGVIRYNTDIGLLEQYTSSGWVGIDVTPAITSIAGILNQDTNSTITINGSNFKSGAIVSIEGAGVSNVARQLTTTYVSTTQLTANTAAASNNYVGNTYFNVRVTNPSGMSTSLSSAGVVDRTLTWSTSAGTLATIYDTGSNSTISTLSASDPDGTSVTYSIASGSLPTGVSLNSANGLISGNSATVVSSTTYPFTIAATSNTIAVSRSFNIIVNPARDGSTSARATTPYVLRNTHGITTNGLYWIRATTTMGGVTQTSAVQAYVYFNMLDSKDWVLMMDLNQTSGTSGSIITTYTPADCIGNSVPWKGFCLQKDGSNYYSYYSSWIAYNQVQPGTGTSGGNKGGYQVFLGQGGGHGWYRSDQGPCSWSNCSGSVGAGYDGSCGTYPTSLRMGTGRDPGPYYDLSSGNWRSFVWMDNAT